MLRIWALNLSLMARPAASSAAEAIRRPVDKRRKLACNRRVALSRERWAFIEAILVLTLSPILKSSGNDPLRLGRPPGGSGPGSWIGKGHGSSLEKGAGIPLVMRDSRPLGAGMVEERVRGSIIPSLVSLSRRAGPGRKGPGGGPGRAQGRDGLC